jgi:dolichol-phosphate mannosyltransferase
MADLWVVVPVYNEENAVALVINEWINVLRGLSLDFVFCVLNDGSSDKTLAVLKTCTENHPELRVVDKPNTGHGQTCITGYQLAINENAEWIFQIDSDGQCDPCFFSQFWQARSTYPVLYGYRFRRDDGWIRMLISRCLSVVMFCCSGSWISDSNVPYRLMHRDTLSVVLSHVPTDFYLANVFVAICQQKQFGIHWIPIRFRERFGEPAAVNLCRFLQQGRQLLGQLLQANCRRPQW